MKNNLNIHFILFLIIFIIILLIFIYLYFFYFVAFTSSPYHYKNPDLQIIKNKTILQYYEKLQLFNIYGLTIPVGVVHCDVLLLTNIGTTKVMDDFPIYTNQAKVRTMILIKESLGGDKEMTNLIENGKLSLMDVIPVRISNNDHIQNLPPLLVEKCVLFTTNEIIPIIHPKYIVGFGAASKKMLAYMESHPNLFYIQPIFINKFNLIMYKIKNLYKNIHYYFIDSIHPSSIYFNITVSQAESLDNVFKFIRDTMLKINPDLHLKIFNYKKFVENKKGTQ